MKHAHEYASVQDVTVWALLDSDGVEAGKVVWRYGDSRTTCSVYVYQGELRDLCDGHTMTGIASGHGYCRRSAALWDALARADIRARRVSHGNGMSMAREEFTCRGYRVLEVI